MNTSYALVSINEVMYAPGDGNEWVELLNTGNTSINLANWTLLDDQSTDQLVCCSFDQNCSLLMEPFRYALITDQDTSLYSALQTDALKICVDDQSIGNGLSNNQDHIEIHDGSSVDLLDYSSSLGGLNNNRTLEKRAEGTWGESIVDLGTPGRENSIVNFSENYLPLIISEVFPDPFGTDNALKPEGEWIELYNSGDRPIHIENTTLHDLRGGTLHIAQNKVIGEQGVVISPRSYLVVYRDGDSDFSLNNDGLEVVKLSRNGVIIDEFSYSGSTSGMSWSVISNSVYLTAPTPQRSNELFEDCDWLLYFDTNNSIHQPHNFSFEVVASRFLGLPQNITVEGAIEDEFGRIIRDYHPWTNIFIDDKRSIRYSPNLPEGIYQISFWYNNLTCRETDPFDNRVTKLIAINQQYKEFPSNLAIDTLYVGNDEEVQWGDQFTAKITLYKGNTTKTAVEVWVEKEGEVVSSRSKVNVYEEFRSYAITLPVQLHSNCNHEEADDGNALVIVEGLGLRAEKPLDISGIDGSVCQIVDDGGTAEARKNTFGLEIIEFPIITNSGEAFPVKVQLVNDGKDHTIKVWSYLYRGKKCYSCRDAAISNDANMRELKLRKDEVKALDFVLQPDEGLEEGNYKLKVKMIKDAQKTVKEMTKDVYVTAAEQKSMMEKAPALLADSQGGGDSNSFNPGAIKKHLVDGAVGIVVYESNAAKSQKLIPYFLLVSLSLVIIVITIAKSN